MFFNLDTRGERNLEQDPLQMSSRIYFKQWFPQR